VGVGSREFQAGVTQETVNKALQKIICHGRHLKEDLEKGNLQGHNWGLYKEGSLIISEIFLACFHFSAHCPPLPH
jgi:hypothetical protein